MKNRIPYLLCAIFIFSLCSCSNSEFKKGQGGLLYKIIEDKDTPNIGEVAYVSISYSEATEGGMVLAKTGVLDARPAMIYARMPDFKGDFQDALQYLSEGDSAILKVSMDSLKRKRAYAIVRDDTSRYMVYHVRVNKVINRRDTLDTVYRIKIEQFEKEEMLRHKTTESKKIKSYLAHNKLNYVTLPSGIMVPADLKLASNGDSPVRINFSFSSLDGKVYETNIEDLAKEHGIYSPSQIYAPFKMSPGQARFTGFREALMVLPKGKKVKVIIPSDLAYGAHGSKQHIPAFMPLVCEFEILENRMVANTP